MKRLAVALLAVGLAGAAAPRFANAQSCPPRGDATKSKVQALNEKKARVDEVTDDDIDDTVSADELFEPGDDRERFQDGTGVEITAYVADVRDGGPASSNCHASGSANHDTILVLIPTANSIDAQHGLFTVVTPQWRRKMGADGSAWSTGALRAKYLQQWVTVRGWLLFNFEAAAKAIHTSDLTGPPSTRATAWEIHPATSIDVTEDVFDEQVGAQAPFRSVGR